MSSMDSEKFPHDTRIVFAQVACWAMLRAMATRAVSIAVCTMALVVVPCMCAAAAKTSDPSFEGQLRDVEMRFSIASPRQVSGVGSHVSLDTPLGTLSGNSFAGIHRSGRRPVIGARLGMQYDASAVALPLSLRVEKYQDPAREADMASGSLEILGLPLLRVSRLILGHLTLSEHADLRDALTPGDTMVAWSTQPVVLLGVTAWSQGFYTIGMESRAESVDDQLALASAYMPVLSLRFDVRANETPDGLAPSFAGVTIAAAAF